jgi:VanZ family protein
MKPAATTQNFAALPVRPLAGLACTGITVLTALLVCAPEPFIKAWSTGLVQALGIQAPAARDLVLDAPKLWHILLFGLLTLALLRALPGRLALAALTTMAFGTALELAQVFIPTRTARPTDLLFNLAGVLLALLLFKAVKALKPY